MNNSDFVKAWILAVAGVLISTTREIDRVWSAIPETGHVPLLVFAMLLSLSSVYYWYKVYRST
jgi:hypothetical protein